MPDACSLLILQRDFALQTIEIVVNLQDIRQYTSLGIGGKFNLEGSLLDS